MKLFSFVLFYAICLFSSLSAIYGNSKPDTVLLNGYLDEANRYFSINPDSSYFFADKAYKLAIEKKLEKYISKAFQQLGKYAMSKEDFSKALDYFLKALAIEEKRNDPLRIASLNNSLGHINQIMEKFQKSLDYHNIAYKIFVKYNDTLGIVRTLNYLGNAHINREYCETRTDEQKQTDYRKAISYYLKVLDLSKKINNEYGIMLAYTNLGNTYRKTHELKKAEQFNNLVINRYRNTDDWHSLMTALRSQANTYIQLKKHKEATAYFNECVQISKKQNMMDGIQYIYGEMAYNYQLAGQYKDAMDYYIKYMTLRDSVYNSEKSKQIFELETKYQTVKKEKEIYTLLADKRKKNIYIVILISFFTIASVIGVYNNIHLRNKKVIAEQSNKLNEQKIKEMEKERQLLATQSVLKGEEAERTRLARDLHDGLGGLLSGVKLKLSNLKGNYITSQTSIEQFDLAVNLLDNSIKELRRVAHNMMPEALVKFGLKDALQDFCERISTGKELKLSFQFFGESIRIDQTLETTIYRIAQELVNNALKHAKASEIIVQIMQDSNRIHLTVQDNGIGFNPKNVDTQKSSGLQNLRARIESFNGLLEIASNPNTGTEISVEFTY
jgi:signal transduction histidine kinase